MAFKRLYSLAFAVMGYPLNVTDDGYVDWLTSRYPDLLPWQVELRKAQDVYLRLSRVVVTEQQMLEGTATWMWPTAVVKPKKTNEVDRLFGPTRTEFTLTGRSYFRMVMDALKNDNDRVFLFGPQGVGKSHVLASLALYLSVTRSKGVTGGDRTAPLLCFIPDMKRARDQFGYLRLCLLQAFIDTPEKLAEIAPLGNSIIKLTEWMRLQADVYFVADQCNEVGNLTPQTANNREIDEALFGFIRGAGLYNKIIFAASSNQQTVDVFQRGGGADESINILVGKFTTTEYCAFVRANFRVESSLLAVDPLPAEMNDRGERARMELIEQVTGYLPLRVYELCLACEKARGNGALSEATMLECLYALSEHLNEDIYKNVWLGYYNRGDDIDISVKVETTSEAVAGRTSFSNVRHASRQIDWRYFYAVGSMIAQPVSELARVAIISATVRAALKLSMDDRLHRLSALRPALFINPSVTGYIVEAIVNECLCFYNWNAIVPEFGDHFPQHELLNPRRHNIAHCGSAGHKFSTERFEPTLLIPKSWQHPLVDSIFVYQTGDCCYVIGIQITTTTPLKHSRSMHFVTDTANHLKYIPQAYWADDRYKVGLLWIVHEADLNNRPGENQGQQAAISLESFQSHSGVPLPARV